MGYCGRVLAAGYYCKVAFAAGLFQQYHYKHITVQKKSLNKWHIIKKSRLFLCYLENMHMQLCVTFATISAV